MHERADGVFLSGSAPALRGGASLAAWVAGSLLVLAQACGATASSDQTTTGTGGQDGSGMLGAGGAAHGPAGAGGTAAVGTGGATGMLGAGGATGMLGTGGHVAAGGSGGSDARADAGVDASHLAGSGGSVGAPARDGGTGVGSVPLVPASGALLGAYYGDANIAATATKLGRKLPIHLVYYAWDDDWTQGASEDLDADRIPLINWEPDGIDFKNITSGSLDSTIKARAQGAKNLGKSFFLDFAAEMNGDEAWSGNDAALYVTAYKHIHDAFVAAGATNVVWAWCPNVTDTNGGNSETLSYYPGDDYVDWTGVDGYNWGNTGGDGWQSFKQVFARIYPILAPIGKPIIIGEMASAESGGDKGAWIDAMLPALRDDYPMIKAVVWFDVNKETDWRISSSAKSEAAFIRMANDPYFNP